MRIKDRPEFSRKAQLLTMGPDTLVSDAAVEMSRLNYGAVVVVSPDERPIGIVTERDLLRRLLAEKRDPATTPLRAIMTSDLKIAQPEDDLLDWLRMMSNDRFRHVPVMGEDGRLITIMSQGDFVSYTWPQLLNRVTEQARATFDLSPSLFLAFGGAVLFFLAVIAAALSFG
jgi:CBS domain-containing protein